MTETTDQMKARWAREQVADQAAVSLGLARQTKQHGIMYWTGNGEQFRAGYWAGREVPAAVAASASLADIWERSASDQAGNRDGAGEDYNQGVVEGMRICAADLRAALAATPALPDTEDSSAGDLAEGPAGSGGWKVHAESLEKECAYWKTIAETMRAHACKDVWYWQGDGSDNPQSMVNSLAVVLRADQLCDLLAQAQAEVQAEPVMIYHGRCTIDCGEHGHHDVEMLKMIPAGAKLYTTPQAQPADAPIAYLQESDQHLLHRFIETTEDDESFDIGKDAVKRLANLGVVESCGFGRYGVTMFGYWVHEHYWHQNPSLPLKTNADRDREHRAAMAAAQEGSKQ